MSKSGQKITGQAAKEIQDLLDNPTAISPTPPKDLPKKSPGEEWGERYEAACDVDRQKVQPTRQEIEWARAILAGKDAQGYSRNSINVMNEEGIAFRRDGYVTIRRMNAVYELSMNRRMTEGERFGNRESYKKDFSIVIIPGDYYGQEIYVDTFKNKHMGRARSFADIPWVLGRALGDYIHFLLSPECEINLGVFKKRLDAAVILGDEGEVEGYRKRYDNLLHDKSYIDLYCTDWERTTMIYKQGRGGGYDAGPWVDLPELTEEERKEVWEKSHRIW